jgi:hypothetical protein
VVDETGVEEPRDIEDLLLEGGKRERLRDEWGIDEKLPLKWGREMRKSLKTSDSVRELRILNILDIRIVIRGCFSAVLFNPFIGLSYSVRKLL